MSALDQAFIKAYAKETHIAPAASAAAREPSGESQAARAGDAVAAPRAEVEQLYDNAVFYRVEPASGAPGRPHYAPAERKVPRRMQRRGALPRSYELESEPVVESVPSSSSARREIRRPQNALRSLLKYLAEVDVPELPPQVELAPESVSAPPVDKPQPSSPPAAPFTQNRQETPVATWSGGASLAVAQAMPVQGHWDAAENAPVASPVLLIHGIAPKHAAPAVTVDIRLPEPTLVRAGDKAAEAAAEPGARSGREGRRFRLDAGHASPTPHKPKSVRSRDENQPTTATAKSGSQLAPAAAAEESPRTASANSEAASAGVASADSAASAPAQAAAVAAVAPATPLTTAAAPLALASSAAASALPVPMEMPPPGAGKQRLVPLWEVDSFAWPVACDKLFRNESGLFAGMSEKLRGVCAGGVKTLAVTGSRRGEGRTTLALCLARAAAQAGLSTALIDADFSRPQVAASLGLDVAYGWHEAAQGKAPLSEAAVRSLKDRVTVLPLDSAAATAGLSWNDPRVTAAVRTVAAAYDLTIVDLGPLPGDARLFPDGEKCPFDGALVVRDVRYASLPESQHIGERLYACGVSAVGVAENFVK